MKQEQDETSLSVDEIIERFHTVFNPSYDVFISYSYLDDPCHALGTALLLKDSGFLAYLPKRIDPAQRRSPKLAEIELTQVALSKSKALISLNSTKASRSHWIPWEIGYMSGSTGKVAIQSIADEKVSSRNREFVKLYPSVGLSNGEFTVNYKESGTDLKSWINKS